MARYYTSSGNPFGEEMAQMSEMEFEILKVLASRRRQEEIQLLGLRGSGKVK